MKLSLQSKRHKRNCCDLLIKLDDVATAVWQTRNFKIIKLHIEHREPKDSKEHFGCLKQIYNYYTIEVLCLEVREKVVALWMAIALP